MTYKIPDQNNLYGTISGIESKKALADIFEANGWTIRKSTWTDFEVSTVWAEITIEGEDKTTLINGVIDPKMFDDFRQFLDSLRIGYSIELYDDKKILLKEMRSKNYIEMKLAANYKAGIRFFIYYLVNGTLNFDLFNNRLRGNYHEYLESNPQLFFAACCVFINHTKTNSKSVGSHRRSAELICKSVEPDNFTEIKDFEDWEINSDITTNDFFDSFKDFAKRISFEKLDQNIISPPYYKHCIINGASYLEQAFSIWANNLDLNDERVANQEYAIERATKWMKNGGESFKNGGESFEEWELDLEFG
jgi:hypothetical protein